MLGGWFTSRIISGESNRINKVDQQYRYYNWKISYSAYLWTVLIKSHSYMLCELSMLFALRLSWLFFSKWINTRLIIRSAPSTGISGLYLFLLVYDVDFCLNRFVYALSYLLWAWKCRKMRRSNDNYSSIVLKPESEWWSRNHFESFLVVAEARSAFSERPWSCNPLTRK